MSVKEEQLNGGKKGKKKSLKGMKGRTAMSQTP